MHVTFGCEWVHCLTWFPWLWWSFCLYRKERILMLLNNMVYCSYSVMDRHFKEMTVIKYCSLQAFSIFFILGTVWWDRRFGPCLVFESSNFLLRCGFCLLFYSIRMLSYVVKRYKEQYFIDCFSLFWDHFVLTFILNILPCWSSLFPCMAESGKGSCISPVSMGNVITWRCCLYKFYWLLTILWFLLCLGHS